MSERYRTLLSLIETYLKQQTDMDTFIQAYQQEWWADSDSAFDGPEFMEEWAEVAKAKLCCQRGLMTGHQMRAAMRGRYLEIARKQGNRFDFVSRNFVDDIQDWLTYYCGAREHSDRTATPDYLYDCIHEEYMEYLNRVTKHANRIEACHCAVQYYLFRKRGPNLIAESPSETAVPITISDHTVEAVIDTEFEGDIALPLYMIGSLRLMDSDSWTQRITYPSANADGYAIGHVFHPLYFTEVQCGNFRILAGIVATEGKPSISSQFPSWSMESRGRVWAYNRYDRP